MKHLTDEEKAVMGEEMAEGYRRSEEYYKKRMTEIDETLYELDPKYRAKHTQQQVEKGRTEAMKEVKKRYAQRLQEMAAREQIMNPVAEAQIGRIKHAITPEAQRQSVSDSMTEKIKRGGNL